MVEFAVWAYPWDLLDEGVEQVAGRLAEIGVTEVTLATNYHTTHTFHPHNPERRTFFARPSAYFQPDGDYGRLEPVVNETMGERDWLAEIADALADTGVDLSSWTIGCHNSRLGRRNPDLAIETPHGDPLWFGLCPSKPAVQQYLTALLADLDDRAPFRRIELETFDYFYGTGFGWHHRKFHTRLGDLGEFLLGLCFCEDCRAHAADAGVDVETARATARATIDALAEGDLPPDVEEAGWLLENPAVLDYATARTETLTALFADLDAAVDDADLGYYVGHFGVESSWKHGADLDALAEHVDYYAALSYGSDRAEATSYVDTARAMTDVPITAGLLPGHPLIHDEATVVDVVEGFVDRGADRVSFYNYGLLPERNLDWIGTATAPYR